MILKLIDAGTPLVALIFIGVLLVWYRVKRKFPKDRGEGRLWFLDANIVELLLFLMFIAIAAPDWGALIFNLGATP